MANEIQFVISADTAQGQAAVDRMTKSFQGMGDQSKESGDKTSGVLDNIATHAGRMGLALSASVTAPIVGVAALGVSFNAMQENAVTGFTTMLGSAQKAQSFLSEMKAFAAATPFEYPDLIRAAQRLMAMGFAAKDVKPLLTSVGDAVSAMGGGAAEIDRVTLALGQMQGRGKVATQEMNQLTEVGIPAWRYLAEGIGVSETKLRDMVEKGAVPAGQAIEILTEGMDQNFGGMTEKASKNFTGLFSTIKDTASFIAADAMKPLFDMMKSGLEAIASALPAVQRFVELLSPELKTLGIVILGAAAAIGPLLLGISGVAALLPSVTAGFGLMGISITAAGVAAVATTAGIVALGAALGIGIGLLINYAIEGTRVQKALDGMTLAVLEADGRLNEVAKTTQKAADVLKDKYGVEIDHSKMSVLEWNDAIVASLKAHQALDPALQKNIEANRVYAALVTAAADATKKHTADQKAASLAAEEAAAAQAKFRTKIDEAKDAILGKSKADLAFIAALHEINDSSGITIKQLLDMKSKIEGLTNSTDPLIKRLNDMLAMDEAAEKINAFLDRFGRGLRAAGTEQKVFAKEMKDYWDQATDDALKYSLFRAKSMIDLIKFANDKNKEFAKNMIDGNQAVEDELRKQGNAGLDRLSAEWRNKQDIVIANLEYQLDGHRKTAGSVGKVWEQATGNITSSFAKGFSDVIFHAKDFGSVMKGIAMSTAESMFQAFLTGLLSPLTSRLSSLGKQLADTLSGATGGGGIGGALGGGKGLLGALGGWGGVAGLGLAAGTAVYGAVKDSQAHWEANDWVQGYQNPFDRKMAQIHQEWDNGTPWNEVYDQYKSTVGDYLSSMGQFASLGKDQYQVIVQAQKTFMEKYGFPEQYGASWWDVGTAPSYAVGTSYVPADGPAYLHKGEAVLTADQNRGGAGRGGVTINLVVNGSVTSEENLARTLMRKIQEISRTESFVLQGAQ